MEGPNDIDSLEFRTRLLIEKIAELTGDPERDHQAPRLGECLSAAVAAMTGATLTRLQGN